MKVHIIFSFICLHCCNQYRIEIGLPENLAFALKQGTFEELLDSFPEVLEEIEHDEFQSKAFRRFIFEHGQHDVRFLATRVESMPEIVRLRTQHYKRVVAIYQQYKAIRRNLKRVLRQTDLPTVYQRKINKQFDLKEDKKKR